jgi:hypothetical protein
MKRSWCWWGVAVGLATASLVGCTSAPGSQRIVGPDGSAMAHVHCGDDQGTCFRIAGELCPSGYDIQPVLSGSDGNFLVRCRTAAPAVVAVATPSPAASAPPGPAATTAAARSTSETWPPAHEPWPTANPWAPPQTSAAVQPPRAAPNPTTEVDLGY